MLSTCTALTVRAHPRSRGEHTTTRFDALKPRGSSPLTRGALVPPPVVGRPSRLIPAHAGSTVGVHVEHVVEGAHPRSRGEHLRRLQPPPEVKGSSPLTRGAHLTIFPCRLIGGLIPAHAGSTGSVPASATKWWAHPRSRGEHANEKQIALYEQGSSPLTRGAPGPKNTHE